MFSKHVESYWNKFCKATSINTKTEYDAWGFGDSKSMSDELADLVIAGEKTTSAGSVLEHELNNWKLAKEGDYVVILDGDQQPKCVIQYTEVQRMKFHEMQDAKFAQDEGEGFDTLELWRAAHKGYFSRVLEGHGRQFSEDMEIICMRFTVVYP